MLTLPPAMSAHKLPSYALAKGKSSERQGALHGALSRRLLLLAVAVSEPSTGADPSHTSFMPPLMPIVETLIISPTPQLFNVDEHNLVWSAIYLQYNRCRTVRYSPHHTRVSSGKVCAVQSPQLASCMPRTNCRCVSRTGLQRSPVEGLWRPGRSTSFAASDRPRHAWPCKQPTDNVDCGSNEVSALSDQNRRLAAPNLGKLCLCRRTLQYFQHLLLVLSCLCDPTRLFLLAERQDNNM